LPTAAGTRLQRDERVVGKQGAGGEATETEQITVYEEGKYRRPRKIVVIKKDGKQRIFCNLGGRGGKRGKNRAKPEPALSSIWEKGV